MIALPPSWRSTLTESAFDVPMKSATNEVRGCSYSVFGSASCSTRPPSMTAIRSDIVSASSWSWVT